MEAPHCAFFGNSVRRYGTCFGDVDKTKGAVLILAPIVSDLCPTQRTRAIKINCGFRKLRLHADLLKVQLSVDQHRRFTNVRMIPNLSNEELGYVRARDDPVAPLRGLDKNPVAAGPRSTGQNSGSRDGIIKFAFLDHFLLQTLIVISAAEDDLERQALKAADTGAAITSAKTGHTDQTFDTLASHRGDQHSGRVREQVHRPEQIP